MSSDVQWYLKCNNCGAKIKIVRLWLGGDVEMFNNEAVKGFINEHIWGMDGKCCNYELYDETAVLKKKERKVGFKLVRE